MSEKCYIIAEIGCEHLGSVERAKELIDAAKNAGADAVKFQLFYPDEVGKKVWNRLKRYNLTYDELVKLKQYADRQNIDWLCSAFGTESLHCVADIGLRTIKIPSPCLTNYRMLDVAGELFQGIILSTGMHTLEEVQQATDYLNKWLEPKSVAVLHCVSAYPCLIDEINLRVINTLRQNVKKAGKFGLSDHTMSIFVPALAIAIGAEIIEKHITLPDRKGPDGMMALINFEFSNMVTLIRRAELQLGDGIKKIEDVEESLLWRRNKK